MHAGERVFLFLILHAGAWLFFVSYSNSSFFISAPAINQERIIIYVQVRVSNLVPVYNGWESVDEISLPMGIAISHCIKNEQLKTKLLRYCMIRYLCLKNSGLVSNQYDKLFESSLARNFFVKTEQVVEDSIQKFAVRHQ